MDKQLEVGKRYYLDAWKDCSGVFIGSEYSDGKKTHHGFHFKEIEGESPYIPFEDGVVGFGPSNKAESFCEYETIPS